MPKFTMKRVLITCACMCVCMCVCVVNSVCAYKATKNSKWEWVRLLKNSLSILSQTKHVQYSFTIMYPIPSYSKRYFTFFLPISFVCVWGCGCVFVGICKRECVCECMRERVCLKVFCLTPVCPLFRDTIFEGATKNEPEKERGREKDREKHRKRECVCLYVSETSILIVNFLGFDETKHTMGNHHDLYS